MLSNYVPIVGLFALAAAFALFSVAAAPLRRPAPLQPGQARRLRVRHRAGPPAARRRPVPGQVLPDRDAVHRLRHRDHLPLPVGRRPTTGSASSAWSRWSCSSSPSSSPTPTCGAAAGWSGTEASTDMGLEEKLPSGVLLTTRREAGQLDPQVVAVAGHLRPGLLRHRDDGDRRRPLRPGPLRHGGLPGLAAPGRPDDRGRPGEPEDGPGPAPDLRPDARAALGARRWASAPARGGMFNNYAIVQGVDHIVPVDMYLPGCPPRPEMLIDAILKLHDKIMHEPLGAKRPPAGPRQADGDGRRTCTSRCRRRVPRRQGAAPRLRGGGRRGPRGAVRDRAARTADAVAAAEERRATERRRRCPATAAGARPGAPADAAVRRLRQGMFGVTGSGDTSGFGGLVRVEPAAPSRCTRPSGRTAATSTRSPTRWSEAVPGLRRRASSGSSSTAAS